MEAVGGVMIGVLLIGIGAMIWKKQAFLFLAGFREIWTPVHETRLARRLGRLTIILGCIAILTALLGEVAEAASLIVAIITIIAMIAVMTLDQLGY